MEGTGENMFCSNCGCELQDGWSVCPNCGMRIEEEGRTSQMNVGTNQYDPNSVQMQGNLHDRNRHRNHLRVVYRDGRNGC